MKHQRQAFYEHIDEEKNKPTCWLSMNNNCMPHFHSGIELVYIENGKMNATLNGKLYKIKHNQLLLVPSYTVHLFVTEKSSHTYVLKIPIGYIYSIYNILRKKTFSKILVEDEKAVSEIARSMKIIASWENENADSLLLKGHTYIILATLLDKVPLEDISPKTNQSQVRDVIDYLHNNYLLPLSLDKIATIFGYSKSRFSHIFNDSVGCGLTEYINSLRSRHAANLLLEETNSIIDVAMNSGFESMRTFYRSFKRNFAMTPSQYIADVKGKNT